MKNILTTLFLACVLFTQGQTVSMVYQLDESDKTVNPFSIPSEINWSTSVFTDEPFLNSGTYYVDTVHVSACETMESFSFHVSKNNTCLALYTGFGVAPDGTSIDSIYIPSLTFEQYYLDHDGLSSCSYNLYSQLYPAVVIKNLNTGETEYRMSRAQLTNLSIDDWNNIAHNAILNDTMTVTVTAQSILNDPDYFHTLSEGDYVFYFINDVAQFNFGAYAAPYPLPYTGMCDITPQTEYFGAHQPNASNIINTLPNCFFKNEPETINQEELILDNFKVNLTTTVGAAPSASLYIGTQLEYCSGEFITLTASSCSQWAYNWSQRYVTEDGDVVYLPVDNQISSIGNQVQFSNSVTTAADTTITIRLTVSSGVVQDHVDIPVLVRALPAYEFVISEIPISTESCDVFFVLAVNDTTTGSIATDIEPLSGNLAVTPQEGNLTAFCFDPFAASDTIGSFLVSSESEYGCQRIDTAYVMFFDVNENGAFDSLDYFQVKSLLLWDFVDTTTTIPDGVENILRSELILFPNPAQDNISFVPTSGGNAIVRIYNSVGQLSLLERRAISSEQRETIGIQALNSGMYIISVEVGGATTTKTFLKD